MTFLAVLTGLAGGFSSGLLGVGGGVVFVPLLTRYLHLDQRLAHGTSLAILVFTSIAGAIVYGASGSVDWRMAVLLAIGATAAAPLGAATANRWEQKTLRRAFGALLALVGVRMFLIHLPSGTWLAQPGVAGALIEVATGAVVGYLSGLLGVGGGTILVPILTLLFGVPQVQAQGMSLWVIVPTAISGSLTHLRYKNIAKPIVLPAAAASIVAASGAALLAHHVPAATLKIGFGALLVWMGVRTALFPPALHKKTSPAS